MAKGNKLSGNQKRTNYQFRKRCISLGCKKRAKYLINDKPYCKVHWMEV